jgi:hypothetical protein
MNHLLPIKAFLVLLFVMVGFSQTGVAEDGQQGDSKSGSQSIGQPPQSEEDPRSQEFFDFVDFMSLHQSLYPEATVQDFLANGFFPTSKSNFTIEAYITLLYHPFGDA